MTATRLWLVTPRLHRAAGRASASPECSEGLRHARPVKTGLSRPSRPDAFCREAPEAKGLLRPKKYGPFRRHRKSFRMNVYKLPFCYPLQNECLRHYPGGGWGPGGSMLEVRNSINPAVSQRQVRSNLQRPTSSPWYRPGAAILALPVSGSSKWGLLAPACRSQARRHPKFRFFSKSLGKFQAQTIRADKKAPPPLRPRDMPRASCTRHPLRVEG